MQYLMQYLNTNVGITILDTSVDYRLIYEVYNNDAYSYIKDLIKYKNKYKNKRLQKYKLNKI